MRKILCFLGFHKYTTLEQDIKLEENSYGRVTFFHFSTKIVSRAFDLQYCIHCPKTNIYRQLK
jgi:hypothetical protein